jgi:hypothetical protein
MAENRGINYFNVDFYEIRNRDLWLEYLPKFLKHPIKFLLKVWDKLGFYMEKLKRPFRAIKNFFKNIK